MENLTAATTTREAILLLGPTGSGKTPLGQVLEERGLWGHAWSHFDFGANLREIVDCNEPDESIGAEDIALLRRMVPEGLLLEDAPEAIRRKLAIFAERTAPLLYYYRNRPVRIETCGDGYTRRRNAALLRFWSRCRPLCSLVRR